MNEVQLQHFVDVQAFKYDGTLYRQWNGTKIILDNEDYVGCLLNKTKVIEKDGQKWVIKEPTLWFFSKKNFFNTTIIPSSHKILFLWLYVQEFIL